uniref:Uncharacterized protein n=1 Tax=Schistocephalus solidus TaxID=70667 RepID=A0A0X3PW46_SCHSO
MFAISSHIAASRSNYANSGQILHVYLILTAALKPKTIPKTMPARTTDGRKNRPLTKHQRKMKCSPQSEMPIRASEYTNLTALIARREWLDRLCKFFSICQRME